jgi:hypothetical protein
MIAYTITYKAPRSAQPRIMFKAGSRLIEISTGEAVPVAGNPADFATLPPGVTATPTFHPEAKPKVKSKSKAPRSTMTAPAKGKE